jgi:hypothetical protein
MEAKHDTSSVCSRRKVLGGSALLLAGGVAGFISSAHGTVQSPAPQAPTLPWPWVKLDPNEAGRRAYQQYLKNKG